MKRLVILLILLTCTVISNAQTKGYTMASWFQSESISLNGHKDFSAVDLVIASGYNFNPSWFTRLQFDMSVGMWRNSENGQNSGNFRSNMTLGPTIGYNIVKYGKGRDLVDVTATVGKSLINKNAWSYHFYDTGVSWTSSLKGAPGGLMMGLGVRYYDSHNAGMGNFCSIYAKIGFRFN